MSDFRIENTDDAKRVLGFTALTGGFAADVRKDGSTSEFRREVKFSLLTADIGASQAEPAEETFVIAADGALMLAREIISTLEELEKHR